MLRTTTTWTPRIPEVRLLAALKDKDPQSTLLNLGRVVFSAL